MMRKLVEVGSAIADSAFNPTGRDAAQLLDEAEAQRIRDRRSGCARQARALSIFQPLLTQVVERIDILFHRDNPSILPALPLASTIWTRRPPVCSRAT